MATNIRFHYLYRDSGNYKKFGQRDYSNLENLTLVEIERQIRQHLIDGEFFYPEQARIPKFRFHRYLDESSGTSSVNLNGLRGGVAGRISQNSSGGYNPKTQDASFSVLSFIKRNRVFVIAK